MDLVTAILLPLLTVPLPGQGVLRTVCKSQGFRAKPAGRLDKLHSVLRWLDPSTLERFLSEPLWYSKLYDLRLALLLCVSERNVALFWPLLHLTPIRLELGLGPVYVLSGLLACCMWPLYSSPWVVLLPFMGVSYPVAYILVDPLSCSRCVEASDPLPRLSRTALALAIGNDT